MGYRYIACFQIALTVILALGARLWKLKSSPMTDGSASGKPLTMKQIFSIRGAKHVFGAFFCYCALEQTALLWGASYMVGKTGISAESAARLASLFCIGITVGRAVSGFLTMRMKDVSVIRLGEAVIVIGVGCMLLPLGEGFAMAGLTLVGLGCAPIYPCILHCTPRHFGAENSQAMIGMQMACAYVGIVLMPPVFGLIANHLSVTLLPVYLLALLVMMFWLHEAMLRKIEE